MAATYGFRVYIVEAYPNRVKDNGPLLANASSNVKSQIVQLLERAHSMSTQEFKPRPSQNGEPDKPAATLTVGEPTLVSDDFVSLVVESGTMGSHTKATKIGAAPQDLSDRSAEAAHRFALLFSQQEESKFLVVVQTINRRDPMRRLVTLLHTIGINRRNALRDEDKAARAAARAAKKPLPKTDERIRLHFRYWQATDSKYLQDILGSAKSVTAVFKGYQPSSRGGSQLIERSLRIELRDGAKNKIGSAIAQRWERRQRSGKETSKADGVIELADALGEEDLVYDGESDHYDDAALSVVAEHGSRSTIAVDSLRDVFTYPIHEGAPSKRYFYSKVAERLPAIAQEAGLKLRGLDSPEAEEWLAD